MLLPIYVLFFTRLQFVLDSVVSCGIVWSVDKNTESIRLRLDVDLLKRAGRRAKLEQRTTSSLIRFALAKYLSEVANGSSGEKSRGQTHAGEI